MPPHIAHICLCLQPHEASPKAKSKECNRQRSIKSIFISINFYHLIFLPSCPMLKKYTAILMMFTAYAILLGHNIIPHHHHDHDEHLTGQHNTHHNHDDGEDNDGLNHMFSHFTHAADGFSFTPNHNISNTFSKLQLSLVAVLPDNFALSNFDIPPLLGSPPAEHLIYISPHSHSSGLRAPPAFIA